ncbi:hypothetical protein L6164_022497 [Bauhinia variegata]|uniref:Uncharacterized protein n=1 Tax=Bauhinia variegata TaxID=167791 RepID=A0ACB9MFF3_BAUVA|nr:hypothetical protein L6164_022497 [Bauhinia variegata]
MRFFLEFVSCCGSPSEPAVMERASLELRKETSTLVPAVRYNRRKKRGRAAQDWRPSLGSISEDNDPPQREREVPRNGTVRSEREAKRKSASPAKVRCRSYNDDFRQHSVPTIVPAFSPTPFMF